MTTNQQQAQDEIAMLDHPGLKNAIADSLKKIGEHRQDFEQAMVDLQAIDKKIAEFDAQIAAKKSEADEEEEEEEEDELPFASPAAKSAAKTRRRVASAKEKEALSAFADELEEDEEDWEDEVSRGRGLKRLILIGLLILAIVGFIAMRRMMSGGA